MCGDCCGLEVVEGAASASARAFHDVEVDHGGRDIGMAEEGLDGSDVGAGFEQVCGERMAECVGCDAFGDGGFAHGIADLAGHGVFVEVVAENFPGGVMRAEGCGGKEVLPAPLA